MRTYLYLSMTPESLVASMLPPDEFGRYLAVGTRKSAHGRAMFFDLKEDFSNQSFDLDYATQRCVAHADGRPKNSLYLSIYRVLERVPLEAINSLWLATEHGKVLELKSDPALPAFSDKYYLYQEVCPVHPLIASKLSPAEFAQFITKPNKPLYVPKTLFPGHRSGRIGGRPGTRSPSRTLLSRPLLAPAGVSDGVEDEPDQGHEDRGSSARAAFSRITALRTVSFSVTRRVCCSSVSRHSRNCRASTTSGGTPRTTDARSPASVSRSRANRREMP